MTRYRLVVGIGLALVGCNASTPRAASTPTTAHSTNAPLLATLSVEKTTYTRDAEVEVVIVLTNRSGSALSLPTQVLDSPILLLEVRSAGEGDRLPTMPPPTPSDDARTIGPEERLSRTMRLDMFSPPLPAGNYTVTAHGPQIESNTVRFRIGK